MNIDLSKSEGAMLQIALHNYKTVDISEESMKKEIGRKLNDIVYGLYGGDLND